MMYQQQVGPTMSIVDNQSVHSYGQGSAVFGTAAGQDLTSRPNMNRQMADFNIQSKPINSSFKINQQPQGVIPVQPMAQCELQMHDDARSEFSVRTHSQFGQTSSYFSGAQAHHQGALSYAQHSPMSHAAQVHNRAQQTQLEEYNKKAQHQRKINQSKSPGRDRSQRSGSRQRQMQESCVKCDILTGSHSTSNFSAVTGAQPGQNYLLGTAVSHRSLVSDVSGMQQAEMQALLEEQKTQARLAEKEKKLQDFRAKTATTAQQKLKKQQAEAKKEAELKKAAEKERMLKAREFAREQREKAARKAQQKKMQASEEASLKVEPNPHAYKNTHVVRPRQEQSKAAELAQKKVNSTIIEQDGEESEASAAVNIVTQDQITKQEIDAKKVVINQYKRIDQITLNRVGLRQKQLLTEQSIGAVFNFTQLQRFRQNRNLEAFDKAKPMQVNPMDSDSNDSDSSEEEQAPVVSNRNVSSRGQTARSQASQLNQQIKSARKQVVSEAKLQELEEKWWLQGDIEAVKRSIQAQKEQAQKQVEKERYLTALKVLVSEKGQRMSESEIPNLCSCGALKENITAAKNRGEVRAEDVQMCANNCQFYKDTRGYERALRDILHCISLFK